MGVKILRTIPLGENFKLDHATLKSYGVFRSILKQVSLLFGMLRLPAKIG